MEHSKIRISLNLTWILYPRVHQPFQLGSPEGRGAKERMIWGGQVCAHVHAHARAPVACVSGAESARDAPTSEVPSACEAHTSEAPNAHANGAMSTHNTHVWGPEGLRLSLEWACLRTGHGPVVGSGSQVGELCFSLSFICHHNFNFLSLQILLSIFQSGMVGATH